MQQENAEMPRMYCHVSVPHTIVKPEVQSINKNERGIVHKNLPSNFNVTGLIQHKAREGMLAPAGSGSPTNV